MPATGLRPLALTLCGRMGHEFAMLIVTGTILLSIGIGTIGSLNDLAPELTKGTAYLAILITFVVIILLCHFREQIKNQISVAKIMNFRGNLIKNLGKNTKIVSFY